MKYGRHKADAIISKPISYFCLRWEQTPFSAAVSLFYHKQPKQVSILAKWVFIFKNISQKVPRKHNKMRVRRCNDSWTPYLYIRQNFNRQLMNWAGFFFLFWNSLNVIVAAYVFLSIVRVLLEPRAWACILFFYFGDWNEASLFRHFLHYKKQKIHKKLQL